MSRRKHNRERIFRPFHRHGVVSAVATCAALLFAEPAKAQDADSVLRMASASWRVQEWPEATLATREHIRAGLTEVAYQRLAIEHSSYFARGELRRRLRAAIDPSLPAFQRALDFYRETPGSLLLDDREAALTPASIATQPLFLADRFSVRGASTRLEVIHRIDEATHLSNDLLQVARASMGSLAEAAARMACLPLPRAAAERQRALASLRRMEGAVQSRAQLMLEFAHRDRGTLELAREAQTAEGTLRSAFTEFSRVLDEVLRDADRDFLARIDQLAAESCPTL